MDELDELDRLAARDGVKWSRPDPGVIAAWIADMDFPIAPTIREALIRRIDTDLGYPSWGLTGDGNPLAEIFAERMRTRYGFAPDPAHVRLYNDINQALQVLLHAVTSPNDAVALHTPAYPPFLETLAEMDRPALPIQMEIDHGEWRFDLERLAADVVKRNCRVLLLVNPHNPTGRVFTKAELDELAEIAAAHELLVISDEIHADLTYSPHRHIPFGSLGTEIAERTITLTSATKAFNLAGVRCAVAHIAPPAVRQVLAAQPTHMFGEPSVLGVEATAAAWLHGDDWLNEVRGQLDRNRRRLAGGLPAGIGYLSPQATYLAWLDCQQLGPDPAEVLLKQGRIMLSPGTVFGPGGDGFARLNFATTGSVLEEILERFRVVTGR